MFNRKNKKDKKVDVLQMTNAERVKFMREVRKALQDTIVERKLWNSLLSAESLEINGKLVYNANTRLNGLNWNRV